MPEPESQQPLHPPVIWAQRKNLVYVTVEIEEMEIEDLTVNEKSLHIKGVCPNTKRVYDGMIEFYGDVDGAKFERNVKNTRTVELTIPKSEEGWWPRLSKDKKVHWIKVDFNKWKDEDESDDEGRDGTMGGNDYDFSNIMGNMGGGGMGDEPNLDDFGDSDAEDMPDLEDESDEEKAKSKDGHEQEPTTSGENGDAKEAEVVETPAQ